MAETYLDIAEAKAHEFFLAELHRIWGGAMPLDAYRAFLEELRRHEWAKRQIRTLVLRDAAGAYLSHLRLYAVRALHRDRDVWLGGIGTVLTPVELRRQGHAGRLLQLTLELLGQEGIDGAYLFSDIDPEYYGRLGFRTLCDRGIECQAADLPETAGWERWVRPARADDWASIREIHSAAGKGQPLWLTRDESQWDFLLGRHLVRARHDPGERFVPQGYVVEKGGRATAYAIAGFDRDTLHLLEFGMERPDGEQLDLLLSALRAEAAQKCVARIAASWPPGSWSSLFQSRFTGTPRKDGIYMLKALSDRLDVEYVVANGGGYWETDHI